MNSWTLEGKKALVTGASKGIGRAITEEFLKLGASVIAVARSTELLEDLQQQHKNCTSFTADLATGNGIAGVVDFVHQQWPQLDVLVNNLGMNIRKPTLEYPLEDLRTVMKVNVESAFSLNQQLYPLLKASGHASVINISSVTSMKVVQTSTAAYHMSKGALDELANFLAVEWGKDNIRVNSIHPWYIATPLGEQVLQDDEKKNRIVNATPLGRVGQPHEVAHAAAFFAMEASSYISGAHLPVDGAFACAGI